MNYEEKYKQALERARIGLHDCNLLNCDDMTRKAAITTIYNLFPELAESDDERIRKGIIRNLQYLMDRSEEFVKEDLQERIAWLEKQVDKDKLIKEYEEYINWLEKQGEKRNTHKREIDDAYLQGICDAKHAIEKQGESPRTNIEIPFGANDSELQEVSYDIPKGFYTEIKDGRVVIKKAKFKVGDWIVGDEGTFKVTRYEDEYGYELTGTTGYVAHFVSPDYVESHFNLWTIQDAKDGDVLVSSVGNPFIFSGKCDDIHFDSPIAYCGVTCENKFREGTGAHWTSKCGVAPATKEQRDLLFSKMKEAGYAWNADKKELKKMEVASKEGDDERIRKAIHIYLDWLDGRKDYQPKGVYTIRDMIDWVIKQDKKISADKVVGWLVANICDFEYYVKRFKQDFGL